MHRNTATPFFRPLLIRTHLVNPGELDRGNHSVTGDTDFRPARACLRTTSVRRRRSIVPSAGPRATRSNKTPLARNRTRTGAEKRVYAANRGPAGSRPRSLSPLSVEFGFRGAFRIFRTFSGHGRPRQIDTNERPEIRTNV